MVLHIGTFEIVNRGQIFFHFQPFFTSVQRARIKKLRRPVDFLGEITPNGPEPEKRKFWPRLTISNGPLCPYFW